jgi:predicted anti-sigma-YlaC factor YlaD
MIAGIKTDCKLVDAELDRQFAGRGSQLSPEVQRHLDECERCRTLYSYLAEEFPAYTVSREVEHQIVQTIQGSLKPVSRLRSTAAITAQFMIVFLLISAAVISRMKVVGFEVMNLPQLIGISTILSFGVVLLALSLAWQMRPGSLRRITEWASVGILAAGLLVGIVLLFPWKTSDAFVVRGLRCLRAGLVLAAPVALVFWFLVRRGAAPGLRSLGGTLGAIAGLLAVTVLQYTCDLQDIGHLLVWHCGVLVLSTLAGALVGDCLSRFGQRFR